MMSALKTIAGAVLLSGFQAGAAFADDPPKLDVAVSCNAASQFAIMAGRDKEACLEDERSAESTLGQTWSKFRAADKTMCIGTVKTGGPASYVELLSCLEVMRDAKDLREGEPVVRSDQPASTVRRRRR
jgi:hypothetical protein